MRDVCTWIESIGLGQYRKKFLHNLVDGYVLFTLDDALLKQEIGIGPLGHRVALLRAIDALCDDGGGDDRSSPLGGGRQGGGNGRFSSPARGGGRPSSAAPQQQPVGRSPPQEYPRRPASASTAVIPPDRYLGPAAGKVNPVQIMCCPAAEAFSAIYPFGGLDKPAHNIPVPFCRHI